jgi:peptide/nickel transport system permease protein
MPVIRRGLPAALVIVVAVAGPWLAPHPIDAPVTAPFARPGSGVILGGDVLGRDVLSRVLHGGRGLLVLALVIAFAATAIGTVVGVVAALRPALGRAVERLVDLAMLVPAVLVVLLVVLSWEGGGRVALAVAATAMSAPYAIRVVASAAAPVVNSGFVEAAAAGGERLWALVWREAVPNLRSTLFTLFGLRFVEAVYVVTAAGFLEVGPQPPAADWALMVRENGPGILLNPWAVLVPSLAVGLLAVGVNLAADARALPLSLSQPEPR